MLMIMSVSHGLPFWFSLTKGPRSFQIFWSHIHDDLLNLLPLKIEKKRSYRKCTFHMLLHFKTLRCHYLVLKYGKQVGGYPVMHFLIYSLWKKKCYLISEPRHSYHKQLQTFQLVCLGLMVASYPMVS